jgi:hypothetical protein
MKRKEAVYKGLQFNNVYFTDTSLTSPDYFQISEFPNKLTAGKNLFKLRGHPTNLKVGGYLNIEVLDYNGDPIYHQIVDYIDEDKSRVVAIYIYEDTSPGDCVVTLTAEAVNVPQEWQGRANIKWNRQVPVNPNVSNDSEIIFEKLPTVTITEQVGTQLDRTFAGGTQFPTYSTGSVKYYLYNNQPAIELTGGLFTSDMSTGTITVATPVNALPTATYIPSTTAYSSTIKKILSPSLALLDSAYTVYSSQSISSHTYSSFDASTFSLPYEATPIYSPTENSESFALIQISGLQPATGDVSRIKTFMNNNGQVGTWELINDIELTETEIFVANTASLYPDTSIGLFTSQSIINAYWEAHTYQGRTETTAPTLTYTTSSISNAMSIVSATNITAPNAVHVVQIKDAFKGIFVKDASYKITLDALGIKSGTQDAKLSVYLSGSAFDFESTDYFNQELPKTLGKRIGEISVNTVTQRFDDYVFDFEASDNGTAVLLLVVEAGTWQVADIRTTSDNDAGYTPDYTRIRSLVPTAHKSNNQLTFKIEYYNFAGVKSKQINYLYNKNWEGGNRYVDGEYSMLTGSLYVADSLESGIAISGYKNSGFVRSLGYEGFDAGFPGFLLWSGSALTGQTSIGSAYSGVGLELYANTSSYFRYSTRDNEIDVRTKTYFFGDPNSTYVSGSNGLLEISSSNFLLSSSGDVIANNALFTGTAQANIILDKSVRITTSNSSSYLQQYTLPDTGQTGYRLVLDGSLSGSLIRKVEIQCNLNYPIGEIKTPAIGSTKRLDVTIASLSTNCTIYDKFTSKYGILIPVSYPTLYIPNGETIILSVTDPTAATYVGGSYSPFDYVFNQMLTTNYNLRVSHSIVYTNIPVVSNTITITAFTSSIVLVDTSAGSVTFNIPTAATQGSVVTIKKVGGTNSLILNPTSTTTIDGALTKTTTDASASIQLLYVNSVRDYLILNAYGTWT